MIIGLLFFIRAATKDRTATLTLVQPAAPPAVVQAMTQHFQSRAYTIHQADPDQNQVSFRGMVRPSLFLAIFLTTLAGIGMLCLALVLASLFPGGGFTFLGLIVLAPAAGVYYWRRAKREEGVTLQVIPATPADPDGQSEVTVIAHRDELIALQQALKGG